MTRIVVLSAVALFFACSNDQLVHLTVPAEFEEGSELLFVFDTNGAVELYARDLAIDSFVIPRDFSPGDELRFEAWQIPASLEALDLSAGRVELRNAGQEGAYLFAPSAVRGSKLSQGAIDPWHETPPSDEARAVRLDGEQIDCLLLGGCFDDGPYCLLPCMPSAPEPPTVPAITTPDGCNDNWVSGLEISPNPECEPWTSSCPRGLVETNTCPTPGDVCPDFTNIPADFYVSASALLGGTGARDNPYSTIADALDALGTTSGVIALGPGNYRESVAARADLRVVGACPAGTTITGTVGSTTHMLALETLTLEGSVTIRSATVSINRAFLRQGPVLVQQNARGTIINSVIENVRVEASETGAVVEIADTTWTGEAANLEIHSGARGSIERSWFQGAGGILARDLNSHVSVTDVVFLGGDAAAVTARNCATAKVSSILIHRTGGGVRAEDASIDVEDVTFLDARGFGFYAQRTQDGPSCAGAELISIAHRLSVRGALNAAVQIQGAVFEGVDLALSDSVPEGQFYGRGLNVQDGAKATVSRMSSVRHHRHAVRASTSVIELFDVYLADNTTGDLEGDAACPGLMIADGASIACESTASFERFLIENNDCGVSVVAASLDLRDGEFRNNSSAAICSAILTEITTTRVRVDGAPFAGTGGS